MLRGKPLPKIPGTLPALLGVLMAAIVATSGANCPDRLPEASSCQLIEEGYGPAGSVDVRAETVVSGLEVPWAIGFLPNGDMVFTERPGRVRLVKSGTLVAEPVALVNTTESVEGGLLGLAVHPRFSENRFFYLYATVGAAPVGAKNVVDRYVLSEDGRSASFDRRVIDDIPAGLFHDGGRLAFGPDGMLYVGTGDSWESSLAQDPQSPAGKILRVTPEGEIPGDNPFPGSAAWLIGIRNVQAFDWLDKDTILLAEHGPTGDFLLFGHDRILGAHAGENLGWPLIYGCGERDGVTSALLAFVDPVPPGGAAFYSGESIAEWRGDFLVATLGSEHLQRLVLNDAGTEVLSNEVYFQGEFGRLREAIMGPDGHLYLTTSNCEPRGTCPPEGDRILRITR